MTLKKLVFNCESLKPIAAGLIAVVVFFLTTPFALLDFDTFWSFDYPKGVLWQFLNVGQAGSWPALWANAQKVLWKEFFPRDFSLPFYLILVWGFLELVIGGIRVVLVGRGNRGNRGIAIAKPFFLWFFPVIYFLLVIRGAKFSSHYFLPIYPFVCLVVGAVVGRVLKVASNRLRLPVTRYPLRVTFLTVILGIIFLPAFSQSLHQGIIYSRADTRTITSRWVDETIPAGGVGAVIGTEDICIVADGVEDDYIRELELLRDYDKYDFVVVTKEARDYAIEKLTGKGFELAREISATNPTRRGPGILIFRKTKEIR